MADRAQILHPLCNRGYDPQAGQAIRPLDITSSIRRTHIASSSAQQHVGTAESLRVPVPISAKRNQSRQETSSGFKGLLQVLDLEYKTRNRNTSVLNVASATNIKKRSVPNPELSMLSQPPTKRSTSATNLINSSSLKQYPSQIFSSLRRAHHPGSNAVMQNTMRVSKSAYSAHDAGDKRWVPVYGQRKSPQNTR